MSGDANHIFTIYWSSVIVDDFHLIRAIVRPDKADAILVIDPDTVLSLAISSGSSLLRPLVRGGTSIGRTLRFVSASYLAG